MPPWSSQTELSEQARHGESRLLNMRWPTKQQLRRMQEGRVRRMSSGVFGKYLIDLVSDESREGGLKLAAWDEKQSKVQFVTPTYKRDNLEIKYSPPDWDPSVRNATRIPSNVSEYGSCKQLVDEICKNIKEYTNLQESSVLLAAYAVLASWFPETFSSPISVSICGQPGPQRQQLFYILSCMYRRPLLLSEISLGTLCSLPIDLYPSLFIEHFDHSPRMQRALRATLSQNYFPSKGKLIRTSCMTVMCMDEPMIGTAIPGWSVVEIPVTNSSAPPPFLTMDAQIKIAESIQPKLLMYRLKNFNQVKRSTFDGAPLKPPVQELCRSLGACIVDDPKRQKKLSGLLKAKEEQTLQDLSWDPRKTVLEALVSLCRDGRRESVYVSEVAAAANKILQESGEPMQMTFRAVGSKIRSLGLTTRRLDSAGRGFLLTNETRKRINSVADEHGIFGSAYPETEPNPQPGTSE